MSGAIPLFPSMPSLSAQGELQLRCPTSRKVVKRAISAILDVGQLKGKD